MIHINYSKEQKKCDITRINYPQIDDWSEIIFSELEMLIDALCITILTANEEDYDSGPDMMTEYVNYIQNRVNGLRGDVYSLEIWDRNEVIVGIGANGVNVGKPDDFTKPASTDNIKDYINDDAKTLSEAIVQLIFEIDNQQFQSRDKTLEETISRLNEGFINENITARSVIHDDLIMKEGDEETEMDEGEEDNSSDPEDNQEKNDEN